MTSNPSPEYPALDPAGYLDLAKKLMLEPEEAARRTAADRAYYAAFLTSLNELEEKGYLTPYRDERDHRYVSETLKRRDVLGTRGNDEFLLRLSRNRVTYDTRGLAIGRAVKRLQWMLDTAEDIIQAVRRLPPRT